VEEIVAEFCFGEVEVKNMVFISFEEDSVYKEMKS